MHVTVKQKIMEAVVAYEDKPRDQWLFDFPAQVALTGCQIWWAADVQMAFERLEEGFETALKDYSRKQVGKAPLEGCRGVKEQKQHCHNTQVLSIWTLTLTMS